MEHKSLWWHPLPLCQVTPLQEETQYSWSYVYVEHTPCWPVAFVLWIQTVMCTCSLTNITRSWLEVSSLSQFWRLWNDCPSSTGNAYLLTTLSELVLHTTGFPVVQIQQHRRLHAHPPPPSLPPRTHEHTQGYAMHQITQHKSTAPHQTHSASNMSMHSAVTVPCYSGL